MVVYKYYRDRSGWAAGQTQVRRCSLAGPGEQEGRRSGLQGLDRLELFASSLQLTIRAALPY